MKHALKKDKEKLFCAWKHNHIDGYSLYITMDLTVTDASGGHNWLNNRSCMFVYLWLHGIYLYIEQMCCVRGMLCYMKFNW